jgi:hypothetical protein
MALKSSAGPKASVMPRGTDLRTLGLWTGLLAGPLATLAEVAVSEAYLEHTEAGASRGWLLAFAGLAALVTLGAGIIAWRLRRAGEGPDDDEATRERVVFMSAGGVIVSAFSLLVLLALLVPKLLLSPGAYT